MLWYRKNGNQFCQDRSHSAAAPVRDGRNTAVTPYEQESFWAWAPLMRDDVTLQSRLSLAESITRMIPDGCQASQNTGKSTVCSTACMCSHRRQHQSSTSLALREGEPVDSLHQRPVICKSFPCQDIFMLQGTDAYEIFFHERFTFSATLYRHLRPLFPWYAYM